MAGIELTASTAGGGGAAVTIVGPDPLPVSIADPVAIAGTVPVSIADPVAIAGTVPVSIAPATTEFQVLAIPSQVLVAVANTVHLDLWNGHASAVVRVHSIRQVPDVVTAVTGVAIAWKLARTTAAGTGGTTLTPWPADPSAAAVPAGITARTKPTGGATEGTVLSTYSMSSEETNTGVLVAAALGGLELLPRAIAAPDGPGLLLRPSGGLRVVQVTSSAAGWVGWQIVFSVE